MVKQNILVEGHGRAKLLTLLWPGIREWQEGVRDKIQSPRICSQWPTSSNKAPPSMVPSLPNSLFKFWIDQWIKPWLGQSHCDIIISGNGWKNTQKCFFTNLPCASQSNQD
jgi:hypothetical protein